MYPGHELKIFDRAGRLIYSKKNIKTNGTAEYGLNERVGLGISASNDEAGLIKRTRVVGSYAYHLPLNAEGKKLSFMSKLDYTNLNGDGSDASVVNFNQRGIYLGGDFGILYSGTH